MTIPDVIPWYWKAGAAVLLVTALASAVGLYGAHKYAQGHEAAVSERAAQDALAIIKRTSDNAALSIKQEISNATITKTKNEELSPVRERIVTQRVYVGSAICGLATPTKAESTAGSDGTDSPGRLARSDVDRDLRELMLAAEEDLATGRACQRFLRENGLVQ
jgi:prophage endopeptidase